jgi:hypothetical protein
MAINEKDESQTIWNICGCPVGAELFRGISSDIASSAS